MKPPEGVAREWLRGDGRLDPMAARTATSLADLLRQRDAEHEALRREERVAVWDAAVTAAEALHQVSGLSGDHEPQSVIVGMSDWGARCSDFYAARRAAVDGAPGGAGEEDHG